jgi:competence protein ComEA
MMNLMTRLVLVLFALVFLPAAFAQDLPEGKGKKLVSDTCSACHATDLLFQFRDDKTDRAAWKDEVDKMIDRGADLKGDDLKTVLDYLAKYMGPAVNVNQATAMDLATQLDLTDAEAQAIVQYRMDNGNFKTWDDLAKVTAVDSKKLEPFKVRITF